MLKTFNVVLYDGRRLTIYGLDIADAVVNLGPDRWIVAKICEAGYESI